MITSHRRMMTITIQITKLTVSTYTCILVFFLKYPQCFSTCLQNFYGLKYAPGVVVAILVSL